MSCVAPGLSPDIACSWPPSEVAAALRAAIEKRLGRRVRGLDVEILPAGVILRGQATSYHAKQLAQQALLAVHPGPLLANEISVCPSHAPNGLGAELA